MTDHIALWLFLILAGAGLADLIWNQGDALIFLVQKFMGLLDFVVFWR